MFSDWSYAIRLWRLFLAATDPFRHSRDRPRRGSASDSAAACGLCPACHEFVYVEFSSKPPGRIANCPRCARRIGHLESPGAHSRGADTKNKQHHGAVRDDE